MGEHVPAGVDDLEVRGDLVVSERVLRDLKLDLLVWRDHRARLRQLVTQVDALVVGQHQDVAAHVHQGHIPGVCANAAGSCRVGRLARGIGGRG